MQVARKTSTNVKRKTGKVKALAKRASRAPNKSVQSMAQKQLAAQKQKQAAQAKQQAIQSTPTAYAPIKYPKQLIRNQHPAAQPQPKPPAVVPQSLSTPNHGLHGLANLGTQAFDMMPKDKQGSIKPLDIDSS
jgi:hypothetical protein